MKRVDDNHSEIVKGLRAIGATVRGRPRVRQPQVRTCAECQQPFTWIPRTDTPGLYCSRACVGRSVGKDGAKRHRGAQVEYECHWCHRKFLSYYKNRKFCSRKCTGLGKDRPADGATSGGAVDANQPEIVAALRGVGAVVASATKMGRGFPDLVVGFRGKVILIEVKNANNSYGRRGLNKNQRKFYDEWQGAKPIVVHAVDEALRAIGAIR